MAVADKLKGMVEELRQDLNEVKEQVKPILPARTRALDLPVRQGTQEHPVATLQPETNRLSDDSKSRGRRISIGSRDATTAPVPRTSRPQGPAVTHRAP